MGSKPKVLMFIDWYLPGYRAGGPIRSCANLVQHLGEFFQFYIVTSDKDYQSNEVYTNVDTQDWVELENGEKVRYLSENQLDSDFLDKLVKEMDFDTVYIHGLFSPRFSIKTHAYFRKKDIRLCLAPRGMLRSSALSLKKFKKMLYLRPSRTLGWYKKTIFHATDEQEKLDIQKYFGSETKVIIAPNLPKLRIKELTSIDKESGSLKLLFAGRIAPEKNLAFALQVLLDSGLTGVELNIYGAVYDQEYQEICKELIAQLSGKVTVSINEPVHPEEMENLMLEHHVLFLPTRGENFGHVILESFMMGRPVLISTETPWRDLEEKGIGYDISLDDSEKWRSSLERMVNMNSEEFDILCKNSYNEFETYSQDDKLLSASKALFLPE